jgi:hypothetical protein
MDDEWMIDGSPWWRNVNMAKLVASTEHHNDMHIADQEPHKPMMHTTLAFRTTSSSPPVPAPSALPEVSPVHLADAPDVHMADAEDVALPAVLKHQVDLDMSSMPTLTSLNKPKTEADPDDISTSVKSVPRIDRPPPPIASTSEAIPLDDAPMESADFPDIDNPSPPHWYNRYTVDQVNKAPRPRPNDDVHLEKIKSGIRNCRDAVARGQEPKLADFDKILDGIHKSFFLEISAIAIRKKQLLHNTGLPAIFHKDFSAGVDYPWYLKEDAAELYVRWWSRDLSPQLFRGIKLGRTRNIALGRDGVADSLLPVSKYPGRRHGKFFGNAHLRNGQWWPTQLAAVRDGAHNASIAGICGKVGEGAYSCLMSGGQYPNIDHGDNVWYYGTPAANPGDGRTTATQLMIESKHSKLPVRLLRASQMTTEGLNVYKPEAGIRYDGLYTVVDFELKDPAAHHYLFHLVRVAGQGPIRFQGKEVRPTKEELEAFEAARFEKKYLVE